MVQKSSFLAVLEIFFIEPTSIHFIKEIGRRVNLAPTAVRASIISLLDLKLVKKKKAKPFEGIVADRENEDFIFYKRVYNLYSIKGLKNAIVAAHYPKLLVLFGSYSLGEDVETSDIDILMISKTRKEMNLEELEKKLKRKINIMIADDFERLDDAIKKKVLDGIVLYGGH